MFSHDVCVLCVLQVKSKVYWEYAKAVGPFLSLFICFLYGCQSAAAIGANFWLSEWTNDAQHNRTQEKVHMRVGVYAALGISQGTVRYSERRHANANLTSLIWLCYLTNHRNTDWTPGHIISFTSTIKGQFTQKSKQFCYLLIRVSFQTHILLHWNKKGEIMKILSLLLKWPCLSNYKKQHKTLLKHKEKTELDQNLLSSILRIQTGISCLFTLLVLHDN